MTYRLLLSLPTGSSVEALTPAQRAAIGTVRGRWTVGGMPGTELAGGRYLIDVLTDEQVTRAALDALGLWSWLIVGCWSWDGAAVEVEIIEPLDTGLLLPHLPADSESGITTLREPSGWAGWPVCVK